jgi:hypothetical protein
VGRKKGDVSLLTYDGRYKPRIVVNGAIQFNEKLQVAKTLVDNRIRRRADGSRSEIKLLVEDAFNVDKQGDINKNRRLGLRRLAIEDAEWREAMRAISDSVQVASTKTYPRFYKRQEDRGYRQIPLDVASI